MSRYGPGVWWMSPAVTSTTIVTISVAVTAYVSDEGFRRQWNTPKAFDGAFAILFLSGGMAVALGALAVVAISPVRASTERWPAVSTGELGVLRRASTVLVVLTAFGYAAFVVLGAARGVTVDQLLSSFGASGLYGTDLKKQLGTAPGLTTMTQFGPAAVIVSALAFCRSPRRSEFIKIVIVVGMSLPRAFFLTERLAVLELVVPLVAVLAMGASVRPRLRSAVGLLPAVAVPVVVGVFALFEYTRSWAYFRTRTDVPFAQFAVERLAGYYTTALNNGALQLVHSDYPGRWPRATLEAFWTAPGISQLNLYQLLDGHDPESDYVQLLATYGNPEFNNAGGIADPFLDWGVIGGLVYFLAVGVIAGAAHCGSLASRPAGMLFYPILFLGLLELPRYLYWSQGRALPTLLGLSGVALALSRADFWTTRHHADPDTGRTFAVIGPEARRETR
ncbi:O-antigen polymerase [Pseudonocardia abyssalis]|uniref:Oligosaccharide repeat unit polymerase n=1 Tax=Pseudonocardia abyssalis TaxID=2792008 RepID=A0ABS6UU44_9PSEU|nr:O-antigen polymerase [Pseudonocardia abyssalis]MBW0114574.1 oligosaccharide repeat unit polymerase [Pseudonocardia abyssalis]MBW0135735.1 oligosaccharide repeat unit polymerase [Pseudonocardia abyssalis]